MDSRPFCVECGRRYRCRKNEVAIRYGDGFCKPKLGDAVLVGDLWVCPGCGKGIIMGWASAPWYPQTEDEAKDVLRLVEAIWNQGRTWVALDEVFASSQERSR